ncbi:hypothetical protein [Dyadobacter sp. CY351]|uniref:hypothetical protein n=1 Tax=Dyadobacter sp. CY351 TaxID=2909337 RepID=UPI001F3B6835|nr:hypothetical protein [Dyadobacter sp. CY351]MCF2517135.1 hypothetical protein [Dyadobacter sp. CY351]
MSQIERKSKKWYEYKILWLFVGAWIIGVMLSKNRPSTSVESNVNVADIPPGNYSSDNGDAKPDNWSYNENIDRMTSAPKKTAQTVSTNTLDFDFPYNGGTSFTLLVRNAGNGNDVILSCSKCQFIHSFTDTNLLKVRFDENKAESFPFEMSTDHSSDLVFIGSESKFLKKLKKANHLIIGAEFYQEGVRYIDFDVSNFKWEQ